MNVTIVREICYNYTLNEDMVSFTAIPAKTLKVFLEREFQKYDYFYKTKQSRILPIQKKLNK